ncbi:hypothetical protein CALVIDRAFT_93863 [Calocera viscosa TUFC12733]|uniref:Protein CPL1-like domain-containing protein n=1 Tax=Calocera viscosa (strain TUFC12733) TaxID=1330018 RepID=A0A167MWZ2_CALVF|nr:hypothetical protein CALVIDRAFT_93863 [Calocera viscosa TUFC12733]
MNLRTTLFGLGNLLLLVIVGSPRTVEATTDTCANLVHEPVTVVVKGINKTPGYINTCLCLSSISSFETSNNVAINAIELSSVAETTAALTNLVNNLGSECTYPANASPLCVASSSPLASSPCSFTCTNGFDLSADSSDCVCELPKAVGVNGLCAIQSTMRKRSLGVAESGCRNGEMACGVPGQPDVWECVDTTRALDSCGGCMFSPPAELLPSKQRYGEDCTEIPNVMSVECRNSACIVSRCHEPYHVSEDHLACVERSFVANHYE